MKSFKLFLEDSTKGTYAAVKPDAEGQSHLDKFMKDHNIPNPESADKLHSTLLYSRKHLPNYSPDKALKHEAYTKNLEVWPTKSGKRCLVLKLDSNSLHKRHIHLMDKHKAEYDYPEFKPHISLSYDLGDFDEKKLDHTKLPKKLSLTHEYHEVLDTEGK